MILPQKLFLIKGKGYHKDKLLSFEMALRSAGIEKQNLVLVSSIFPPGCKILPKKEGLKLLKPGEITFCVMSKIQTQNPGELISSALAVSLPENKKAALLPSLSVYSIPISMYSESQNILGSLITLDFRHR